MWEAVACRLSPVGCRALRVGALHRCGHAFIDAPLAAAQNISLPTRIEPLGPTATSHSRSVEFESGLVASPKAPSHSDHLRYVPLAPAPWRPQGPGVEFIGGLLRTQPR